MNGLEALEKIGSIVLDKTQDENYGKITFRIKHLYSKYYEVIEKELKALEIIKEKEIDVKDITETTDDYDLYVAYCEGKGYAKEFICTQEEFDLLKEVLEDE